MNKVNQNLLQSVTNALKILELYDSQTKELALTEISRRLDIGKSTAHRLLSTLESRKFIEQNQENGRYRLGLKLVSIAATKLASLNIIEECRPLLEDLCEKTGESSHLSFYSDGQITFVDKVMGKNPSVMSSNIGYQMPAHVSASGKIFLAHLSEQELEAFLSRLEFQSFTPYTVMNPQELRRQLVDIRLSGYSEDQQESDEGLVCFAAPVFSQHGKVSAAISLSGAATRMNARKEELVHSVMKAARLASQRCGWLGTSG